MPEFEEGFNEVYLQPGEACISREPAILRTLLGSCVGVTFWAPRLKIGALCHAMLPRCPSSSSGPIRPSAGYRYVDYAIRELGRRFDEFGAARTEVQVKLFGGADVLLVSEKELASDTVGKVNCETALAVLESEGFLVTASCLRGRTGFNIRFNTANGEVQLRRLHHAYGNPQEIPGKVVRA